MKILQELPPQLNKEDSEGVYCAIDIEMGNLPDGKLHHAGLGDFAVMTMTMDADTVYAITDINDIEQALINVRHTQWIMHKGDFDIRHLRHWAYIPARPEPGQYWDTMYVDRIQWAGMFDSFSLQSLSRRLLQVIMEKDTRKEFSNWNGTLTQEQLEYAALDVIYTWRVAEKQRDTYLPVTISYWWDIDNIAFWTYLDFKPIPFDKEWWDSYADQNEATWKSIQDKYPDVLLSSPSQVTAYLNKLGAEVKNSNESTLENILKSENQRRRHEFARDMLEFRSAHTRWKSYGKSWSKDAIQIDGHWFIFPTYDINKASTGRPQASNQAIQTMPVRKTPEFRKAVRALPDYKLIVGDYSTQEPRITVHLSRDAKLKNVFESGGDVYENLAKARYGDDYEVDSETRGRFKDTFLGINYGQTVGGLARKWGEDYQSTQQFYDEFKRTFPVLFSYLRKQEQAKEYVTTVYGRRFWLNQHNWQSRNHKRNVPSQGTAADMKKKALGQMWLHWNEEFPLHIIIDMHDEAVLHVPEKHAERAKFLLERYMIETANEMCDFVRFDVDAKIVDNWLEGK